MPKLLARQMFLLRKICQNHLSSGRRRKLKLTALRLEHKTFPAPTCIFQRHVGADMEGQKDPKGPLQGLEAFKCLLAYDSFVVRRGNFSSRRTHSLPAPCWLICI